MILELLSALTTSLYDRLKTDEVIEMSYKDFSAVRMQLFQETSDLAVASYEMPVNNQKLNVLSVTTNGITFHIKPKT